MKKIYSFIKEMWDKINPFYMSPPPVWCKYRGVSVDPSDVCENPGSEYRKEWLRKFPNIQCESCGLRMNKKIKEIS